MDDSTSTLCIRIIFVAVQQMAVVKSDELAHNILHVRAYHTTFPFHSGDLKTTGVMHYHYHPFTHEAM
jgi:hypothetical protein